MEATSVVEGSPQQGNTRVGAFYPARASLFFKTLRPLSASIG